MRRLVLASAILATLLFGSIGLGMQAPAAKAATPAPTTDFGRAKAAFTYLFSVQRADGSLDGSVGETADWAIGAADFGFDPATLRTCSGVGVFDYLATALDGVATDAGKTAKIALAVHLAGLNENDFRGRNLPARLDALYHPATGAFGDGDTFAQALSVLVFRAAAPAKAVEFLAGLQDTDGSWNFTSAANATDGDTNSTAIALIALAGAGNHAGEAKAFAWLHTQQLSDGGFPYQNSNVFGPPASDPDSDSLVVQALLAAGQDPTAPEWSKGSSNALTHMRTRQAANGGFVFPGRTTADAFTTSQVFPALAAKPLGSPTSVAQGNSPPRSGCAVPTQPSTATPPPTASGSSGEGTGSETVVLGLLGLSGLVLLAVRRKFRTVGR